MCHHYHHHHSLRCMGVWAHCMCRWTMPACVLWTILRLLRMNSDHFHIFTWRYHVCRAMQEVCTKLFVNFSEAKSTNIYSHTTKYIGQFLTRSINNSKRLTAWGLADDICSIYCNWKKCSHSLNSHCLIWTQYWTRRSATTNTAHVSIRGRSF